VGEFWSVADQASDTSLELRRILAERRVPIRMLTAGDRISLTGGVDLLVLSPTRHDPLRSRDVIDENEESLVFRITYGRFSVLFTADAGFAAEQKMMASGYDLKSTVLKVGHHGSRYSTSKAFLERVNPRLAMISSGGGNRFGLPASRTVDLIASKGIPLYRTDRDGTIELVSDGVFWSVSTPYAPD
jgi:competence protein ComEC